MKRREFLYSAVAAAGVASVRPAWAHGGVFTRAQAAKAKASTLERMAIMTLNFQSILKVPDAQENPNRTLELFDIGEMLADKYSVHKVEFQHYHLASTEPSYLKELRSRLAKAKSRATQINLEFSNLNISAPQTRDRVMAVDLTKAWVDHAATIGAQRVMINQGAPTPENKAVSIPVLKTMVDYGKSKGIIVSVETRGSGGGGQRRGGAAGTAAGSPPGSTPTAPGATSSAAATAPAGGAASASSAGAAPSAGGAQAGGAQAPPPSGREAWTLLAEIIKGAGAYSNVDLGGARAVNQQELHDCLKTMHPMSAGTIHARVSTVWDFATAIKFMEGELGYKGLYTIEASNSHEGTQAIYDVLVATL